LLKEERPMAKTAQQKKAAKIQAAQSVKSTKKKPAKAVKPARKEAKKILATFKPARKLIQATAAAKPSPGRIAAVRNAGVSSRLVHIAAPAAAPKSRTVAITVNGRLHEFVVDRDLPPAMTLAQLLKEGLGFTGLKMACDEGACGGCTVLMDGKAVLSCMMLAVDAHGHEVLTIEGLPKNDPVIEAFAEQCEPGYGTAMQCGYCTPGFVMAAKGLLLQNPRPTMAEIKEALSGNICRCGCYAAIAMAVVHASEKMAAQGGLQ
jgi:aerobic-type carbon monoxide dehydrogenase small subunit (CoxS/CutS family)